MIRVNEASRVNAVESNLGILSVDDEPDFIAVLTDLQKEQLGVLLEEYLQAMETGLPPRVESITADWPELCEPLRACVGGLEDLHRMAGGESLLSMGEPTGFQSTDLHAQKISNSGQPNLVSGFDDANRLGDFELHETIGRGGMGVVYRATQSSLRRTVAVKVLPLAAVLDPRQLTRFQHEAEAAANLQHPNIVPVFVVGCERGVHFYAMRYIDGQSLDDWIQERRVTADTREQKLDTERSITEPLPLAMRNDGDRKGFGDPKSSERSWETSVRYAIQVADGLHAAHEFGIVHRDVKPSNLMLDHSGKVWITDFGLARIQSDVSVTGSTDIVGTMRYMSPEQASGDSAIVDGRTDVYSLAATLYEMLTLRSAHEGDDVATILREMESGHVSPIRQFRDEVPRDLETVIAKAMAHRRDQRYETASHFADDLRRVLAGEPTIARPPTVLDLVVRRASKHRVAVMTAAIIGMLAMLGFAVGATMLAAQKQVSDNLATEAQRNEAIAREAVDRLGSQISELLAEIPAARSVRHRLLSETLDYYRRISSVSSSSVGDLRENSSGHEHYAEGSFHDVRQRRDLAVSFGKMGVLQSELGQVDDSLISLQESERLYRELAQEKPLDQDLKLQWSISQNNLAQRFIEASELESAAAWFTKAIKKQMQLTTAGSLRATTELAKTLNNLGGMLASTQRVEESRDTYQRALSVLAEADGSIANSPSLSESQSLRSTIQSNLAGLLTKLDPNEAISLARSSLKDQVNRLELDAGNPRLATEVALTLNTLGTSLTQLGEHEKATESLQQAVEIGQQLHVRWPDQTNYRRDLVISLNHLGMSLSAQGKADAASIVLKKAIEHGRQLDVAYAKNAEVQSMLGGVLNNLAFLQHQIGHLDAAKKLYDDAIKHQELAVALAPQVGRYQSILRTQRANLRKLGGES